MAERNISRALSYADFRWLWVGSLGSSFAMNMQIIARHIADAIKERSTNRPLSRGENFVPFKLEDLMGQSKALQDAVNCLAVAYTNTDAKVIEALRPDKVYVDASDVLEERFRNHILECMPFRVVVVSEHRADRNYAVVSAASIIAKVERDEEIARLANTYGDLGSGYPSDPKTSAFLKECCERMSEYPDFVRKSWRPARKAKDQKGSHQLRLI